MKTINFENILEDFNFLENWEDKYRYIIELGKKTTDIPPNPDINGIIKSFLHPKIFLSNLAAQNPLL